MHTINMLGQPCPFPVVEAKKALSQPEASGVIVLVDNIIAMQNLEKMAAGMGFGFTWERKGEAEFAVTIVKKPPDEFSAGLQQEPASANEPCAAMPSVPGGVSGVAFLITGDQIGISDAEPGKKLMYTFIFSLTQLPAPPDTMILVNAGVKLACGESDVIGNLRILAERGTNILSCGQCLNYYGLTGALAVGKVTNMLEIVGILTSTPRVITI